MGLLHEALLTYSSSGFWPSHIPQQPRRLHLWCGRKLQANTPKGASYISCELEDWIWTVVKRQHRPVDIPGWYQWTGDKVNDCLIYLRSLLQTAFPGSNETIAILLQQFIDEMRNIGVQRYSLQKSPKLWMRLGRWHAWFTYPIWRDVVVFLFKGGPGHKHTDWRQWRDLLHQLNQQQYQQGL